MVLHPAWGRTSWCVGTGVWGKREGLWEAGAEGPRLTESTREGLEARAPLRGQSAESQCALEAWLWAAPCPWPSWLTGSPGPRLAEKKASIGYTYEDSTVAEVEKVAEKPEEEESPAEEESNSDEDEVIPDIGGVPSLPSPTPQSLGIVFVSRSSPSVGRPALTSPVSPAPTLGRSSLCRPPCLTHVLLFAGLPLCTCRLISRTLLL